MGLNHMGFLDGLVASVVEEAEEAEEAEEVVKDHLREAMVGVEDLSHRCCLLLLGPHHPGVVVAVAVVVVVGAADYRLARILDHHLGRGLLLLNFPQSLQIVPSPSISLRDSCLRGRSHRSPSPMPHEYSSHKLYRVH